MVDQRHRSSPRWGETLHKSIGLADDADLMKQAHQHGTVLAPRDSLVSETKLGLVAVLEDQVCEPYFYQVQLAG